MYTVGEFAHLAHVSKRLLRYYDEIGLFTPSHTDATSGYRYYSAEQMPLLNRILALKELGLTLNQIQRTLADDISGDELAGMLKLRKVEIEQQMETELRRIREIEARLESIRNDEADSPTNVIIKKAPKISVLSTRQTVADFVTGVELYSRIQTLMPKSYRTGQFYCICRTDDIEALHNLDLEFGICTDKVESESMQIADDILLTPTELPAYDLMATTVVTGALETIHRGYAEIMRWSATKGYRLEGEHRELCLQMATQPDGSDLITEIQVPVQPIPIR